VRLVVYGRPGCCLCEKAEDIARRLEREYAFATEVVDITGDPLLYARYREVIPVVVLDGIEIARGLIGFTGMRAALARAGAARP
jgi:glutaredoxin